MTHHSGEDKTKQSSGAVEHFYRIGAFVVYYVNRAAQTAGGGVGESYGYAVTGGSNGEKSGSGCECGCRRGGYDVRNASGDNRCSVRFLVFGNDPVSASQTESFESVVDGSGDIGVTGKNERIAVVGKRERTGESSFTGHPPPTVSKAVIVVVPVIFTLFEEAAPILVVVFEATFTSAASLSGTPSRTTRCADIFTDISDNSIIKKKERKRSGLCVDK